MTPVCALMQDAISGHILLNNVSIRGLVDTGASVSCLGLDIYLQHQHQWGPLQPYHAHVSGADGAPLPIAGRTEYLHLVWGERSGQARFIVIRGLQDPSALIGMDLMQPLGVLIDTQQRLALPSAAPTQPNIDAASPEAPPLAPEPSGRINHSSICASILEYVCIPAHSVKFVKLSNPWPQENVFFS